MTRFSDAQWRRAGGSRLEFGVPLDVFQEWLGRGLPPEYAPYVVAGEDRIWSASARRTDGYLYCYPLEQLERALAETPAGAGYRRAVVYFGSTRLTPELLAPDQGNVRAWLSLTGLPGVEVGPPDAEGRRYVGGLVAVEKVVHLETGQQVAHEDYSKIYRSLRRVVSAGMAQRRRAAKKAAGDVDKA